MSKPSPPSAELYFRFLSLAAAPAPQPALPTLDPLEERMLDFIALNARDGARLSVRDMMGRYEFGSPATVHGRLKSLRAKGWLLLEETEDARRKQLALTPAALSHFERLALCLLKAARA